MSTILDFFIWTIFFKKMYHNYWIYHNIWMYIFYYIQEENKTTCTFFFKKNCQYILKSRWHKIQNAKYPKKRRRKHYNDMPMFSLFHMHAEDLQHNFISVKVKRICTYSLTISVHSLFKFSLIFIKAEYIRHKFQTQVKKFVARSGSTRYLFVR
jgi:hypothetical protein